MISRPTLSVIMPNYNHAGFLPESLGAILAQSFSPIEIIILDDASTDNSVEVIERIARVDSRVKLVRNERNIGVEATVNRLLGMATGDYLYSPSADDRILPGFFEKSMTLLARYPQAGLCSTIGRLIDEQGHDRGIRSLPVISREARFFSPEEVQRVLLTYGRWIDAGSVIYRRDAFAREGGQIMELGSFADTFTNLVIALRYGACFIPEPLSCWRQMATGHAARSGIDWNAYLDRGTYAAMLMRTRYGDLFPTKFVDNFERHWMYCTSFVAGKRARFEQEQILRQALSTLSPSPSFVDRIFWFGIRLSMGIQTLLWRLYSMIKFPSWHWWVRGRLSIIVNSKRVVVANRLNT
jgi:glycosyltransferase involved in cell wall biosynthesis